MYAKTVIVGYVGSDAEIRYLRDGTAVANFNVAVNKTIGKGEAKKQTTTWYRVTVWRERAETASQYVKKGMLILVEGEASAPAWLDKKSGEARAGLELTALQFQFLSRADKDGSAAPEAKAPEEDYEIPF